MEDGRFHWRAFQFALIVAAHAAAIAWLVNVQFRPATHARVVPMSVRTVEEVRPVPVEPARRMVPVPRPRAVSQPEPEPVAPPPVLTAQPSAEPQPAAFVVAPQPPAREEPPAPPAVVATLTTVAPRFDAAYLQNPKPEYPRLSRKLGESGKVLLRVQVDASGAAQDVEIAESCGFPRLDAAAREAVRGWRFVPARRGEEAVAASVTVPMVFRLDQ